MPRKTQEVKLYMHCFALVAIEKISRLGDAAMGVAMGVDMGIAMGVAMGSPCFHAGVAMGVAMGSPWGRRHGCRQHGSYCGGVAMGVAMGYRPENAKWE